VLSSDRLERVAAGSVLYVDGQEMVVATSRRHQDRWLVRFEGVDDRTAGERLRGAVLTGDPIARTDEDDLRVGDVIGAEVRDRNGAVLGRVIEVEANPAHDLLVLEGGTLVPAVFVVDHEPGALVVDVPDGLLEVNPRPD